MSQTIELIIEKIQNTKHPFRPARNRPEKPQQHRYERRKVRELIQAGDWLTDLSSD